MKRSAKRVTAVKEPAPLARKNSKKPKLEEKKEEVVK